MGGQLSHLTLGGKLATSFLNVSVDNGLALVQLNRPPVNALDRSLVKELTETVRELSDDVSSRVVIISSALKVIYSAGADIKEMVTMEHSECRDFVGLGQGLCDAIEASPKPMIAVTEGTCVGGGFELMMACDFKIAGRMSTFGSPEVDLGIIPGWGGTQRLSRIIGPTRAMELLVTGELVSADEAMSLGLLTKVVDQDTALKVTIGFCQKLMTKSPLAITAIKMSVRNGLKVPLKEGFEIEKDWYAKVFSSDKTKETVRRFTGTKKTNLETN
ncbi:enoyl-CoA hydratase/isomerase family protein [SAR202 cluster bacterium AD-804-J14_MRT_500m]|nr:enoyl-CoA hydratase/isomerase family protein [SAR202 cluster bacterium AD-804-J14_MRT_500m]